MAETKNDFTVIIADDGSGQATRDLIAFFLLYLMVKPSVAKYWLETALHVHRPLALWDLIHDV